MFLLVTATIGSGVARALPSGQRQATRTAAAAPKSALSSNEDISLDLKDADLRDVLSTFSKLTKIEIVADDDVAGTVTIPVHDVPWKEAFATILDDANLRQEQVGDTIHVHRK